MFETKSKTTWNWFSSKFDAILTKGTGVGKNEGVGYGGQNG